LKHDRETVLSKSKYNAAASPKMASPDTRPMLGKKAPPAAEAEEDSIKEQSQRDPAPTATEPRETRPMLGEKTPQAAEEDSIKNKNQRDPEDTTALSDTVPGE
jgi:hypothetical protein